jgi:Spy/CpxP family protein refolding chaperone
MKAMRLIVFIFITTLTIAVSPVHARQAGTPQAGQKKPAPAAPGASPSDVQRIFDSYALVQAQEQLKMSDDQFARFLTRFKALQDVRRRALQDRAKLVVELRDMLKQPKPDDAKLKDRMKTLHDLEARAQSDVKKAYDAIDEVLDVRQQAKFRVFEETLERRKIDLVMRARQASRRQQAAATTKKQ